MTDKKQKFIVTDKGFKQGRVTFHKDLNTYNDKVIGGGSWYWDRDRDNLYLYGASHDFGSVSEEDINRWMEDIQVRYFKNSGVIFESDEYKSLFDILVENGRTPTEANEMISKNDFI